MLCVNADLVLNASFPCLVHIESSYLQNTTYIFMTYAIPAPGSSCVVHRHAVGPGVLGLETP